MIYKGDALAILKTLPAESIQMCVTSPPYYGLRDYGIEGQIGLEDTPAQYIEKLVDVFREVRRVLKDDGTLWINIGDSYNGSGGDHKATHKNDSGFQGKIGEKHGGKGKHLATCKPKDLIGIPWMLAFALRDDGWYLRQDIIWHKPNPMPESVMDRCTKAHEYLFLLAKSQRYYFDHDAMLEDANAENAVRYKYSFFEGKAQEAFRPDGATNNRGIKQYSGKRNRRDVWSITPSTYRGAHFATFPEQLIEPCILAGSPAGGVVLDCFNGAGTTGIVCAKTGREYIGIELNEEYISLSNERIAAAHEEIDAQTAQYSLFGTSDGEHPGQEV